MTGLEIVSLTFPNIPAAPSSSAVPCPPGKRVLAGGYGLAFTGTEVGQSYPGIVSGNEGWIVSTYSSSGFTNDITVFAICAAATSTGASAKLAAPRQR
jgi:uncharacterized membrane protein